VRARAQLERRLPDAKAWKLTAMKRFIDGTNNLSAEALALTDDEAAILEYVDRSRRDATAKRGNGGGGFCVAKTHVANARASLRVVRSMVRRKLLDPCCQSHGGSDIVRITSAGRLALLMHRIAEGDSVKALARLVLTDRYLAARAK
jgi:hypothetical protein